MDKLSIIALLALVALGETCTSFTCATIDNTGRTGINKICGQQLATGNYVTDITACDEGFICSLVDHKLYDANVQDIQAIAFCIAANETLQDTFRTLIEGVGEDLRFPGDVCTGSP
jgi:hypothetical protein